MGDPAVLNGPAFEELLAANGLPVPNSARGTTPAEAALAARSIGFPVALKIVSPEASHKTEIGGVALNLTDADMVEVAAKNMANRLKAVNRDARIDGFLVQEMVSGVEFMLGVRQDPQFGPFMVVGFGGVAVEAIRDVTFRMLPVTPGEAREMLDELRGKAMLGAFRGRPARDLDALIAAIGGQSFLITATRSAILRSTP